MRRAGRAGHESVILRTLFVLALLAGLGPAAFGQQKRVYIACDDHTDYFWSADDVAYRAAFLQMLDYYLDRADATAGNPSDTQSRFACDGSYWLWEYEHNKTPVEFQRLMLRVRDGHISAPMTALVSCYGGQPAEAVLRGMYYAGRLERRFGTRFRLAVAMEDQTLPWGLASLWAGSGARYSWKGICGCVSQVADAWDREHDIFWLAGPDGQQILMKWNSMLGNNEGLGGYAEARDTFNVVGYVSTNSGFIARYPYPVIGAFGKGWDDLMTLTNDFVTVAQTQSTANRRVIVSNELDFFEDFEANHSAFLPVVDWSYGNEWELLCSSMAEVTASVRRSVERLRGAEALAAIASLDDASFMTPFTATRDQTFTNLGLFWEHDWTADGPVAASVRADWQRTLATQIQGYANSLESAGRSALGARIALAGSNPRFFVFNPLSWSRSGAADFPWTGSPLVHVIEVGTGLEVPSQIATVGGQSVIRVWTEGVPSVGYKTYEVVAGAGQGFANAATVLPGNVLDQARYSVTLDPRGAITSLVDKSQGNREFAAQTGSLRLNDLGGTGGTVTVENAGAVSVTLKAVSNANVAHTTRVTLYRGGDRIDAQNEITQNFGSTKVWDYAFNLSAPNVRHEEVGAIADARLRTQGGDYATQSTRHDWLTLNHFADMAGGDGAGVTLSNADCSFFQLGNSTLSTLDTTTPRIGVLAGGQVAYGSTGIANQGGDSYFLQRFALRTYSARDQVEAMRFALEHQNPLLTGSVTGTAPKFPAFGYSFVRVSNPNVLLWAFKPFEDGPGGGLTLRLWNLSEAPQATNVQLAPRMIASARRTTHIETDEGAAHVTVAGLAATLPRQGMQTFRVFPRVPRTWRPGGGP